MDVGGSFLELACVRIAVIPAGPALPDHRFEELTAHLAAFREVPVNALPRRAAVSRPVSSSSFSSVSSISPAIHEALNEPKSLPLRRSFSSVREAPRSSRPPVFPTFPASRNAPDTKISPRTVAPQAESRSAPALVSAVPISTYSTPPPASPRFNSDLDLTGPDVDSSFRMRYEVIHRDHTGALIMRPFSEWDDFHSTKVWGVFGVVDCTMAIDSNDFKMRKEIVAEAAEDFRSSLNFFKQAAVRRLIVFTHTDAEHNGPFVLNEPFSGKEPLMSVPFSVGHVPERAKPEDTRLEARAQVIHFAGFLLNEIDRECWRRRESPASELFLSPIDENLTTDRQSKLAKRRAGRLDKLLGDSLLLMGSPSDALLKYSSAMERSKASSDRLWLAGAMEGWSAAHVLAHVGTGGSANDKALTDKLIEHYSEIYKLYQKKRVAEPEAAAAMRLAEFLSRWTNRRKEALDAAQHAATVGEGLRTAKRAALWEALARFSDRMGCRRKAAFYLYRLGQLNATQAVLSSAVTLMIAAERQLCVNGGKPWAFLNRSVLLTAAKHAEDAGDSNAAAKLYVEALVTSPSMMDGLQEADEAILKLLDKGQVPACLPAASGVLLLEEISACHMDGLSIRSRGGAAEESNSKSEPQPRDGPFIYNPFEAKKKAKAAANANRAVTWVCDETALVCLRFVSNIGAESEVEIIAVLFNDTLAELGEICAIDPIAPGGLVEDRIIGDELLDGGWIAVEDGLIAQHGEHVQHVLERSSQFAHTVPETVTIHPRDKFGSTKYITVVPRRTGQLHVVGVLVRMFNGALVILQCAKGKVSHNGFIPVNVLSALPRVSVTARCAESEYGDNGASRSGIVIHNGEKRWLRVEVRNCGSEPINWMKARITGAEDGSVEISQDDFNGEECLHGLETYNSSRVFRLQVLGKWRRNRSEIGVRAAKAIVSTLSIIVEYEGSSSLGTIRESATSLRVVCRPAVGVGRVTMFERCTRGEARSAEDELLRSEVCMSVEVSNFVSVPARVVVGKGWGLSDENTANVVFGSGVHSAECLIEHGACARLVCNIGDQVISTLKRMVCDRCELYEANTAATPDVHVWWSLPAMGREGAVIVGMDEVRRAAKQLWSVGNGDVSRGIGLHIEMQMRMYHILQGGGEDKVLGGHNILNVGTFRSIFIEVRNMCDSDLPRECVLDLELMQRNTGGVLTPLHRASLVGVTERVFVGGLCGKGVANFQHEVKVRVASTGGFQVVGYLYDGGVGEQGVGSVTKEGHKNSERDLSSKAAKTEHFNGIYEDSSRQRDGIHDDVNIIYPRTTDSFLMGRSGRRRRCTPLAVCMLDFLVVRDGARAIER